MSSDKDEIRRIVRDAARLTKDLVELAVAIPGAVALSILKGVSKPNWGRYRVVEEDDRVLVEIELPGARKDSIKVFVREGVLYVRAERDPSLPGEPRTYRVKVEIPRDVDESRARARYVEGLLVVELPRKGLGREIPVE